MPSFFGTYFIPEQNLLTTISQNNATLQIFVTFPSHKSGATSPQHANYGNLSQISALWFIILSEYNTFIKRRSI